MKSVIFGFALSSIIAMSIFQAVSDRYPVSVRYRAVENCKQKLRKYGAKNLGSFQITGDTRKDGYVVITCRCSN